MSTIAFVTTMPMSISMPIRAEMPSGLPVISSSTIAPVAANGIDTSRMSGCASDRKVATSSRNTIAIAISIASPSCWNDSCCVSASPPSVAVVPVGRSRPSSRSCTSVVTAPSSPSAGVSEIVATRSPSCRVTEVATVTFFTDASSVSGTMPVAVGICRSWSSAMVAGGGVASRKMRYSSLSMVTLPMLCGERMLPTMPSSWISVKPCSRATVRSTVIWVIGCAGARSLDTSVVFGVSSSAAYTASAALARSSSLVPVTSTSTEPPKPPIDAASARLTSPGPSSFASRSRTVSCSAD